MEVLDIVVFCYIVYSTFYTLGITRRCLWPYALP